MKNKIDKLITDLKDKCGLTGELAQKVILATIKDDPNIQSKSKAFEEIKHVLTNIPSKHKKSTDCVFQVMNNLKEINYSDSKANQYTENSLREMMASNSKTKSESKNR